MLVGGRVLDAKTNQILFDDIPLSSERIWANTHPSIMYGIRFDPLRTVFGYWNITDEVFTELHRFDEFSACSFGEGEGNFSNDDRYVVISCWSDGAPFPTLISYDVHDNKELARLDGAQDLNWASISQSGNYIVVENNSESREELLSYNRFLQEPRVLIDDRDHGDLGIDENGDDVFVMIGNLHISYIRLRDGQIIRLPLSTGEQPLGFGHVSCRNLNRPGWCYISAFNRFLIGAVRIHWDSTGNTTMDNSGQSVQSGVAEFEAWGSHRSTASTYFATMRASASPSGNRIAFASDWFGRGEIATYTLQYEPPEFTN